MQTRTDPSIDAWHVDGFDQLPAVLLDVLLLRRALDAFDGDGPEAACLQGLLKRNLEVCFRFPTASASNACAALPSLTVGQLVDRMALNWECTDYCSRQCVRIMRGASKPRKQLTAYVLSRFSGRAFLDHACEHGLTGSTVRDILACAWDAMASKPHFHAGLFFSPNFEPQCLHRSLAQPMRKDQFLLPSVLRCTFNVSSLPKRVALRTSVSSWRQKRAVMKELKSRRGFGPFVAKNYWSILHSFRRSQLPDDLTYAECGPGARKFLLLLHGHPRHLLVRSNAQNASDFFNNLLLDFRNQYQWWRLLLRRVRETSDRRLVHWLKTVQAETLASLESLQFMCCECSKILSYLATRNSGYLRRGRVPAGDAGQDSESDGASVVWESGSEHDVAEGPAAAGQARGGQMGQTMRRPASCPER